MNPEHALIARKSPLLRTIPPQIVDTLLATAKVQEFSRGATIFLQGERAKAVYVVVEGWVKLYRISPNGSEAVVSVFTKGASFGEGVAFRNDNYPVTAEAATDCRLISIPVDTILNLIRTSPEIAIAILSSAFMHLHSLVAQVEQLKARTGAQRLAEFLLDLAPCKEGACEVTLPYDKALIAGRLGLKPESLSRAFAKLREHGVTVKLNRAIIDDVEALNELANQDSALAWAKNR